MDAPNRRLTNDVPVALLCIELDVETSYITDGVCAASTAKNGGEPKNDRCSSGCIGKYLRACDTLRTLI